MPAVDYQQAWLALIEEIRSRPSHGAGQLLARMAEIEADCAYDEDDIARLVRRFATHFEETFLNVQHPGRAVPLPGADRETAPGMDDAAHLRSHDSEEDRCQRTPAPPPAATAAT